jgi:hypothetical protein
MTKLFVSKRSFDLGPVQVQRDHAKRAAKIVEAGKPNSGITCGVESLGVFNSIA